MFLNVEVGVHAVVSRTPVQVDLCHILFCT